MPIEHANIADPEIHETKGASSATNKEVLVANGSGSTSWQRTTLSDHAQMGIINNSTATAITAATDATLNTDSDYVKITAGWSSIHAEGITFNTDELVAHIDGDYVVDFWCTVKIPLNNNFIGIKYAINDTTPYSLQKIVSQSVTTNDYRNLYASSIVTLSDTNTISVYVAGTKTDNIIIEEAGIKLTLLHEN